MLVQNYCTTLKLSRSHPMKCSTLTMTPFNPSFLPEWCPLKCLQIFLVCICRYVEMVSRSKHKMGERASTHFNTLIYPQPSLICPQPPPLPPCKGELSRPYGDQRAALFPDQPTFITDKDTHTHNRVFKHKLHAFPHAHVHIETGHVWNNGAIIDLANEVLKCLLVFPQVIIMPFHMVVVVLTLPME